MNLIIRPMTEAEHKYSYVQSQQLMVQISCIGRLRGNIGDAGGQFVMRWDDYQAQLKTGDFEADLDAMVNALRSDVAYGGVLASLDKLNAYCRAHPESKMYPDWPKYGFRADTDKYAYMLRFDPTHGEYDVYAYCYVRKWLDDHLKEAGRGIRFITSGYKELFRLTDGDGVRIMTADGQTMDRTCRFIDATHMECGNSLYHIYEFAKQMERAGSTVIPLHSSLPEKCYAVREGSDEIVAIRRGAMGWEPVDHCPEDKTGQEGADQLNELKGVTRAQAAAMLAGSMFGWAVPAADPANYDEQGRPASGRKSE